MDDAALTGLALERLLPHYPSTSFKEATTSLVGNPTGEFHEAKNDLFHHPDILRKDMGIVLNSIPKNALEHRLVPYTPANPASLTPRGIKPFRSE